MEDDLEVLRRRAESRGDTGAEEVESDHALALVAFKRHLLAGVEAARTAGAVRCPLAAADAASEEDVASDAAAHGRDQEVAAEDIDEALCDAAPDALLQRLAGFVAYFRVAQLPPTLASLCTRALVLAGDRALAEELVEAAFAHSAKLRKMLASHELPGSLLRLVAQQRFAGSTLRRALASYATVDLPVVCDLLDVLTDEYANSSIVQQPLLRQLVLWACSGSGGTCASRPPRVTADVEGERRLRQLGERLFEISFLPQHGFLPDAPEDADAAAECPSEPLPDSECPWDTGILDVVLLRRVPASEDALRLARRVLLRCLRLRRAEGDPRELSELWPLGRWPLCGDPALVGQAFALLSAAWRRLVAPAWSGPERLEGEELLTRLFSTLQVWCLPQKLLLTPWVPGQVLAARVAAQCAQFEERRVVLVEETRQNLNEIDHLQVVVAELTRRLAAADERSQTCMQRQLDVNETVRRLKYK